MNEKLEGKVALVTGSTSGIGLAIAEALAKSGASIVLNGFGDSIEKIKNEISELSGKKTFYHGADLLDPKSIREMIAYSVDNCGKVDILVNNAGMQFVSHIEEFPEDKWDQIIGLNLSAAFHATKAVLPHMEKNGWGRIVNISSAHGLIASPFKSAYVASKHGLIGFTKAVALEVAERGITSNAICPGYVRTPLVDKQIVDQAKAHGISEESVIRDIILHPHPSKKFVKAEHIADLVHFLCSDAGESMNGEAIAIDTGWTAH